VRSDSLEIHINCIEPSSVDIYVVASCQKKRQGDAQKMKYYIFLILGL
jgi:hypothetical protein